MLKHIAPTRYYSEMVDLSFWQALRRFLKHRKWSWQKIHFTPVYKVSYPHPQSFKDFKPGIWKPNVLGRPYDASEFSIVHQDHAHGFISFGWDGPDKIILFAFKIPDFLWELATRFTEAAAEAMTKATTMNKLEAQQKGYEVIAASVFEVGLLQNGEGIRTWFCQDFDRKLPSLDHPLIQQAIEINESFSRASESLSDQPISPVESP